MTQDISNTQIMRDYAINLLGLTRTDNRAQFYQLPNGKSVRMRTCRDRALINKEDNLFDTHRADYVAVVMPKAIRDLTSGIDVYLVLTSIAEATIALAHAHWLETNPETGAADGDNGFDTLHFDRRTNGSGFAQDFATKWAKYRVPASHYVEPRGRIMFMDGEIIRGFKPEDFVLAIRTGHMAMNWSPSTSNEDYMRQVAERVRETGGAVRTDSCENFLEDARELGMFEWVKREIEVS